VSSLSRLVTHAVADGMRTAQVPSRASRLPLVPSMGQMLVDNDVDLGDERAVIAMLEPFYGADNVNTLLDDAIAEARSIRARSPHLRIG
jgi:hypothetical protein